MLRRHAEHLMPHVVAVDRVDVQPIEKRRGRRDALFLVIDRADAAVEKRGRRRLAEVVRQRAEHDRDGLRPRQIVDSRSRLIDDLQRVHPDVTLRMPLRFLLAADEREELGEQPLDDAEIERQRQADRRAPGAAAAFRFRPRRARPAGRRAESSGTDRACRARSSAKTAPRTERRAGRAGCRRETWPDRRRAGAGWSRSSRP